MKRKTFACPIGHCLSTRRASLPVCDQHFMQVDRDIQKRFLDARRMKGRGGRYEAAYRNAVLDVVRTIDPNVDAAVSGCDV